MSKKVNLFVKPNSGFNNGIFTIEKFKEELNTKDNCYITNIQTPNNVLNTYSKETFGFDINFDDPNMTIVKNPSDMNFKDGTFVCYDLETTGLYPEFDHITEIGAFKVTMKNGKVIKKESFQTFVKQDKPLKPFISKLTHITDEMLNEKGISEKEALQKFKKFCGNYPMIGHNIIKFDSRMLNKKAQQLGLSDTNTPYFSNAQIDTMEISRALNQRPNHTLHSMAIDANISYSGEENHRADKDAQDNWDVFYLYCIPKLNEFGIKNVNEINDIKNNNIFYKDQHHKVRTIVYPSNIAKQTLLELSQKNDLTFKNIDDIRKEIIITNNPTCSEVFDSYCNDNINDFKKIISKYDFISLPPVSFWTNLYSKQETVKYLDLTNNNDKLLYDNRQELTKLCSKCNTTEERMIALGQSEIFSKLTPTLANLHSMMIKVDYLINSMCDIKKYSNVNRVELKKSNDSSLTIKQIQEVYKEIIKTCKEQNIPVVIDNEMLVPKENQINKFYEFASAHPKNVYSKLIKSLGGCHVYKHNEKDLIEEFDFLKNDNLIDEIIFKNPKKIYEEIKNKNQNKIVSQIHSR